MCRNIRCDVFFVFTDLRGQKKYLTYFVVETWKGLAPEDGREMQCGHDRKVTETWLWDWPTTTMAWEAHLLLRLKFHWLMQVNKINSGQIRGQDYRCCRLQLSVNVLIDAGLRRKINHFSWLENSKFGGSSWSRKGPCDCAIPTHEVMHSESALMAWNLSTWPRKGVV